MNVPETVSLTVTTQENQKGEKPQRIDHAIQYLDFLRTIEKPSPRQQQVEAAALDLLTNYFMEGKT